MVNYLRQTLYLFFLGSLRSNLFQYRWNITHQNTIQGGYILIIEQAQTLISSQSYFL
uniref:Uncharacterized protein n=1 Tax=Lepeophtheirus salmonis TaxID=72036 RepID=A0A0K2TWW8_LEPSM